MVGRSMVRVRREARFRGNGQIRASGMIFRGSGCCSDRRRLHSTEIPTWAGSSIVVILSRRLTR
jgi:hypothetical protein